MKELLKISLSEKEVAAACEQYARERTVYNGDKAIDARCTLDGKGGAVVTFAKKRERKAKGQQ